MQSVRIGAGGIKRTVNDLGGIIMLVVIVGIFSAINANFINAQNIENILFDITPLLIMSIGVTYVLLIGSIDLSVGGITSLACVMTGLWMPRLGYGIVPVVLLFGLLAGLLNGLILVRFRIPSFIITLCTMSVWNCLALVLSNGRSKAMPPELTKRLAFASLSFGPIPLVFLIGMAIMGMLYFIQARTAFGKSVFAVGANERVARMSGLQVDAVKVKAFILSGMCSASCGFFLSVKMFSSLPRIGDPMPLLAIASAVLGGTSLLGGKGSVIKTLPGVLIVLAIQSGFSVVQLDPYWQRIAFGTLVLFAVFINTDRIGKTVVIK
jgi:ribose/xylose/arabinose/galactoside ABC-type transport system permease subunit